MRIAFYLFFSVVFLAGYAISDDDIDADYYYTRGTHYDEQQNYPEAAKWHLKAAELGHIGAQSRLATLYFKGLGVPQDDARALKWVRMAADQGLAQAQENLGTLYKIGRAVSQDYAEAEKWYLSSAKQGSFNTMLLLSDLYDKQRKYVKAIAWAWVAMTLARNYDDEQTARDLRTDIVRRAEVTNEDVDRAEALANSLLQDIP